MTQAGNPDATGLTTREVEQRVAAGQVNAASDVRTKSVPRIFRDNLLTLFNVVNLLLAVAIFATGSYRNLLFMVIIIANVAIGIFQEVRAKLAVDRLRVITTAHARVVRDGEQRDVPLGEIVVDDLLVLRRGDQVPSDCRVVEGTCSANESLVTGESDLIPKRPGSELLSGSFIVAGGCRARVVAVGADNYANHVNAGVKVLKVTASEIMRSLQLIVKYVSIALLPLGALLFGRETLFSVHGDVTSAVLHTSAALIGMIPQGLILLTSAVLAVSVFRLAQHRVLVQQIYCVETLARVDVVCLDKTGTITTGEMEVDEVVPLAGECYDDVLHALRALVAADAQAENETFGAVRAYVEGVSEPAGSPQPVSGVTRIIPFSSERKYSGVCFGSDAGNYALGAAEFVLRGHARLPEVQDMIARLGGVRRVLVAAQVQDFDEHEAITGEVRPLGLVFVRDLVRASAADTLRFFRQQGVRVNVVSGDSVATAGKIARAAGIPGAGKCVDMTDVHDPGQLRDAVRDCRVFGRVSPAQKKQIVQELKAQGHTVAMVGDGVNDVLALNAADCSVAMGSGSDAARAIAQVVLLDDDFASLPQVVAEGRRAVNNLQRSAVLYLTKTLFSIALAVLFVIPLGFDYPFAPVQVTVASFFTIGLPSLVLALEPGGRRIRGDFLRNVATRSAPGAVAVVLAIAAMVLIGHAAGLPQQQFQTLCLLASSAIGLNVIVRQSQPFNALRVVLLVTCAAGLAVSFSVFGPFLMLVPVPAEPALAALAVTAALLVAFNVAYSSVIRHQKQYLDALERETTLSREL